MLEGTRAVTANTAGGAQSGTESQKKYSAIFVCKDILIIAVESEEENQANGKVSSKERRNELQ